MQGLGLQAGLDQLPSSIALFPLSGIILLPRAELPLNIFEPRYIAMVQDALANDRLIGLIQPRESHRDPIPADAPLFETGCAGRITSFEETEDGRYMINLTGLCRFHVDGEEQPTHGYRRARVSWQPFLDDLGDPTGTIVSRDRILGAFKQFLSARELETDWTAVTAADDETLVNALAILCPFEPGERQALLEAKDLLERAQTLITLMDMAAHEAMTDEDGLNPPPIRH